MKKILLAVSLTILTACSTSGNFIIPEGSNLYLNNRTTPETIEQGGTVNTRPFGWGAMGIPPVKGIPYRLEKDGETIKEGRLRSKFRVVSIFWPPYAVIYWPTGLNNTLTYDLVNDKQE